VVWLGIRQQWLMIFFSGLIFDLITGQTLGLSSLEFLSLTGLIYLIKEYWPQRLDKQLKLKI
jgi:cell shape-determining protein MreD